MNEDPNISNQGIAKKKVMWVEDDSFLGDIIARKLSKQDYILIYARNGEEALSMVEEKMPDIILLDILLPGINGFELLKKFKENPKIKNIPVVLLSNLGQKSDIENGKDLGAERYLIKATLSLDEIIVQVKEVLEKIPA